MWLSSKIKKRDGEDKIQLGQATAGGEESFVYTDGERRRALALAPGGYYWRPWSGQELLVLQCGGQEARPFLLAAAQAGAPAGMQDGEVYIKSRGGASIYLRNDGSVQIQGQVYVNGEALKQGGN